VTLGRGRCSWSFMAKRRWGAQSLLSWDRSQRKQPEFYPHDADPRLVPQHVFEDRANWRVLDLMSSAPPRNPDKENSASSVLHYASSDHGPRVSGWRLAFGIAMTLMSLLAVIPAIYLRWTHNVMVLLYVYSAVPVVVVLAVSGVALAPPRSRRRFALIASASAILSLVVLIRCVVGVGVD
jgi:hypothetical protein